MPYDGAYSDLMDKYGYIPADHTAPQFFPVEARKLYDETGEPLEGWNRIVRADTNKTLHVATDGYGLVKNEDAFGAFETALAGSALDLTGMRIGTDFARDGARCFRQYLLPAHKVEVKDGVMVALRLLMLNSYDGSIQFQGRAGAYNFVCANTSISGSDLAQFKIRHSGVIDIGAAVAKLVKAAEDHVHEIEGWRAWPQIQVPDLTARALIQGLPAASRSLVDHLVHQWVVARDTDERQGGPNLWCLYNVLTAWATHGETSSSDAPAIKADREMNVRKLIQGTAWQEIAAAA